MKKQKNGGEITGILLGVLVPCCDCADIFFIVLTTIKIILSRSCNWKPSTLDVYLKNGWARRNMEECHVEVRDKGLQCGHEQPAHQTMVS